MKKIFYAILLFFSLAAHSYDLQHLGTIDAKEYNDVWKQWFDKDRIEYDEDGHKKLMDTSRKEVIDRGVKKLLYNPQGEK